jgi:hypothetical protein
VYSPDWRAGSGKKDQLHLGSEELKLLLGPDDMVRLGKLGYLPLNFRD